MNILIVGNGFDLSHYLPTKYDHFMDVMGAIEAKDTGGLPKNLAEKSIDEWLNLLEKTFQKREGIASPPYDMAFDELFSKTRDPKFIEKTKEFYLTESVEICAKDVLRLQYRLGLNCWYQYFKNHVKEVKTWIDFEIKISEALRVVANFLVQLENTMDEFGSFSTKICFYGQREQRQVFLTREYCNVLELFKILKSGYFLDQEDYDENGCSFNVPVDIGDPDIGDLRFYINNTYILFQSGFSKMKIDQILSELYKQLDEFIEIFNQYLELVVNQLNPLENLQIGCNDWIYPDKIYSFNYTNTYQRFYDVTEVDYLHGSHGKRQNIVLGISELEHDNLKKLKAYGFTKYHQRLFNDTDYLFLDRYKNTILNTKKQIINLENQLKGEIRSAYRDNIRNSIDKIAQKNKLNLNFYIWGHSLDISDRDYIFDLFSLNDEMDRNVKVTVYYFDKNAKFSLLSNLLAILGKDKVELWMKKGWLRFESNPNVVEMNNTQPVDLPTFKK